MIYAWGDQRRFNSYKNFLYRQFGTRVQKLTIDAGFSCPNRDGTIATGGCTYCLNAAFNPSYCSPNKSISQQIEEGISFHQNRYRRAGAYLAYFQAFTNTYAPLQQLKDIYQSALQNPHIVGLIVGTRPDCMDEQKLDFFAELKSKIFVSIEYGIESCHDETLSHINRGHNFQQAVNTIQLTAQRNIHTAAHFIYGLPNENPQLWLDDIQIINQLPINGIKFHQLQIIKGVAMETEYHNYPERFYHFFQDSYIDFIVKITETLNPQFVIERFAGEVPPRFLSVNNWGLERYDVVLQKIERKLTQLDTWQGKLVPNGS